jgi:LacI family transcriptional regulator
LQRKNRSMRVDDSRNRLQMRPARASLSEVAARAGVSTASVSRVINGTASVGAALRARVEQAAAELGYVPNGPARALSSRRTRTVGAVVPSIENAGFAIAVSALQRQLDRHGYTLLLACSDYDPVNEGREAMKLLAHGIDALVLVGGGSRNDLRAALAREGIPCIQTWTLAADGPSVGFDNAGAARQVAEYLLDIGHTDLAIIAGRTMHNDRAAARVQGVRAALTRRGLALETERLIERPYRILDGRIAMRELLTSARPPSAVICGNDQLAFGAMIEARAQGFAVPGAVSITGFNDLDFAGFLDPPLTTVAVPAQEIGATAADLLLAAVAGQAHVRSVELPVQLVVRASTGPPAGMRSARAANSLALAAKKVSNPV